VEAERPPAAASLKIERAEYALTLDADRRTVTGA
jgi:hypothetical protein